MPVKPSSTPKLQPYTPKKEKEVAIAAPATPAAQTNTSATLAPPRESSPVESRKTLDLDTRIALLLKEKAGGKAPPFLQFGSDSEDERKSRADEDMLSDPPSPFLSAEIYKACYEKATERNQERRKARENNIGAQFAIDEDLGSVISSSEDEALLGSYSPAPDDAEPEPPKEPPPPPPPPDDDRMSLSPLSSGDEKIEEVK